MTFLEKFEELKAVCSGVEVAFDRDFAVQINMTDPDCGGTYYVEHRGGVLNVEPYDYHDNDAVMTISSDVLEKILTGEADAVAAFFAGKFTIDGNVEAVLQLNKISEAVKAKKKAEEKAAKEAKKAKEKAAKEAEKKAKEEAKAAEKAKKEAEKKAKAEAEKKAIKTTKTTAKKTTKKEDKQMKLDI